MPAAPGRPRGDSNARDHLILAARQLFSDQPYESVSTRALASAAGVDAALIRYYFGNKAGLFEQMLRESLSPVISAFRDNHHKAHTADEPDCNLTGRMTTMMRGYYRIMAPNPGLARLVQRVLHAGPGSESGNIVRRVFDDLYDLSGLWIQRMLVDAGHLRPGVDPLLARLSLISLMVFPLLAPPVLLQNTGMSLTEDHTERLIQHNVQILQRAFLHGAPESTPEISVETPT